MHPSPTVLYHYPENTEGEQGELCKFAFVDGLFWKNISAKNDNETVLIISSEYNKNDEIVITKTEGAKTTYIYFLRFRGNAFTRPAILFLF